MGGRSVEAALNKFRPRPLKDEMKIRAKRPGQSIPFVHGERTFLVPAQDQDQNGEEKLPKKGKPPLAKKNLNECMQKLTFFLLCLVPLPVVVVGFTQTTRSHETRTGSG